MSDDPSIPIVGPPPQALLLKRANRHRRFTGATGTGPKGRAQPRGRGRVVVGNCQAAPMERRR